LSIQDKLANNLSSLQRKLFNQQIELVGSELEVIRLKTTLDKYEDETIEVISSDVIIVQLDIPSEIPLYRLRGTTQDAIDDTTGLYLYEIIPIEGYSRFEDNVEKFDIIIKKIKDENDVTDPMLMILRVSEVFGSINANALVWKKFNCAPYNMIISEEIQNIIDSY